MSASLCTEYLNICLNHILLRIIACYILLSIPIDKQLFFCDFDFYRFPISIDNKRLIISIVSDYPSIRYASAYWIFVRTTPIKQGSLPTSGVGSTLFGRVRCSYSKNTDQKFPKFWDHGSQKMCTNRDHFILH